MQEKGFKIVTSEGHSNPEISCVEKARYRPEWPIY